MLRAVALSALLLLSSFSSRVEAQPSADVGVARKQAARKYAEGTRAFDAGDFPRAGEAFDAAYALAPHWDALWNGARAWHRAGEIARAANLYARYLRESPPDAHDRPGAVAAEKQLASKLARVEIHTGEGVSDVRVDGAAVDAPIVFVVPGVHAFRASGPRGPIEQGKALEAGTEASVLLEATPQAVMAPPPPPPPPREAAAPPLAPLDDRPVTAERRGWSPVVVLVEAGLTLVGGGLTLWSGLDTMSTLHDFDAHPTQATLESGRAQEVRTNVLIGVSSGLAAITAITALFLVDWRAPRERRRH